MKVEDYENFYEHIIDKYAKEIESFAKSECGIACVRRRPWSEGKIYKLYQRKRDEIKNNYMQKPAKSLDRHKVASCMMYAILKSRPLKVNRHVRNLPERVLMANEYLAVYVAINILEQYRQDDGIDETKIKMIFSITYHEHNGEESVYLNNLCKGLYYIKMRMQYFDIFAYSNILFFLEKYTDVICGVTNKRGNDIN